eukprot:TRINITY_DN4281_c0_g1_i1.p1 TRINITY_DN4281_c0_g1~~TRINITY_DN4281_c0_g1_i1.p1  ORF type:complete len:228 (-),score=46.58 TRINITY_DN4281_c0_g1_i1:129-812(-)
MKIGSNEEDDDIEEGRSEYGYSEEDLSNPILFDKSQRQEDQEISTLSKRMPEKRMNGTGVASHHIGAYNSKSKYKNQDIHIHNKTPKVALKGFRDEEDEEIYDYGLVTKWFGGGRGLVYCWSSGVEVMAHRLKRVTSWVQKGVVVKLRLRPYQLTKADIVDVVSDEEYCELVMEQKIAACDPCEILQGELSQLIFSYLSTEELEGDVGEVCLSWKSLASQQLAARLA